jgi:hypothetical protein
VVRRLSVTCFITPGVPILLGEGELVDGAGEGGRGEDRWMGKAMQYKKEER